MSKCRVSTKCLVLKLIISLALVILWFSYDSYDAVCHIMAQCLATELNALGIRSVCSGTIVYTERLGYELTRYCIGADILVAAIPLGISKRPFQAGRRILVIISCVLCLNNIRLVCWVCGSEVGLTNMVAHDVPYVVMYACLCVLLWRCVNSDRCVESLVDVSDDTGRKSRSDLQRDSDIEVL